MDGAINLYRSSVGRSIFQGGTGKFKKYYIAIAIGEEKTVVISLSWLVVLIVSYKHVAVDGKQKD